MMKKVQSLEVIECSGSPYEVGRQYGEAAKANIIQSIYTLVTRMNANASANKTARAARPVSTSTVNIDSRWRTHVEVR